MGWAEKRKINVMRRSVFTGLPCDPTVERGHLHFHYDRRDVRGNYETKEDVFEEHRSTALCSSAESPQRNQL